MAKSKQVWKPWGDHPIIVGIVVVTALIGAVFTILQYIVPDDTTNSPLSIDQSTISSSQQQQEAIIGNNAQHPVLVQGQDITLTINSQQPDKIVDSLA